MNKYLINSFSKRRTYYKIDSNIKVNKKEIIDTVEFSLLHVPSAFNSQSTRIVILFGEHHHKLWNIVKECLRKIVPEDSFSATESKINKSFDAGFGTILFFEDTGIINSLKEKFPLYANNFPVWSQHTSAMHQLAIWIMLEDLGLGASLQHYNPLIDDEVKKAWNLNEQWQLIAQMPFGNPIQGPDPKTFNPIEERRIIFE